MATPIFRCADLERALSHYLEIIGAELLWREPPKPGAGYAAVRWRGHELHLSSHTGDGAFGSAAYFDVDDVDAVAAELAAHGWIAPTDHGPAHLGPCDQTWGQREFYVRDPDNNCVRFGAPIAR